MKLTERLGKEWVFFDGGMGTILQAHGLKAGELPETWNLSHPDEIIALNRNELLQDVLAALLRQAVMSSTPIPSARMRSSIRTTCARSSRRR